MAATEENEDGYKLFYWGGFTGRAQPIILLLEDAGISYDYVDEKARDKSNNDDAYSSHAFPQLEKGAFVLSQTTAIMKYLGQVHDYDGENPEEKAHVLQVALNAADLWSEAYESRMGSSRIGLTTDHGKTFWQTTEEKPSRGNLWLQRLEANAKATTGQYFFGTKVTYADFCVFNVIHTLRWMYGKHFEEEYDKCPVLKDFEKAIGDRPNVKARLEKNVPVLYASSSHENLPSWE